MGCVYVQWLVLGIELGLGLDVFGWTGMRKCEILSGQCWFWTKKCGLVVARLEISWSELVQLKLSRIIIGSCWPVIGSCLLRLAIVGACWSMLFIQPSPKTAQFSTEPSQNTLKNNTKQSHHHHHHLQSSNLKPEAI
jgi:hypothetical protein